mmetsp:Transcript_22123/g.48108  ORF Transcript_22123/g.48108 Transcript_22123/m.48108 type:complete len:224 (+) Transcript_22123:618-1289(+)
MAVLFLVGDDVCVTVGAMDDPGWFKSDTVLVGVAVVGAMDTPGWFKSETVLVGAGEALSGTMPPVGVSGGSTSAEATGASVTPDPAVGVAPDVGIPVSTDATTGGDVVGAVETGASVTGTSTTTTTTVTVGEPVIKLGDSLGIKLGLSVIDTVGEGVTTAGIVGDGVTMATATGAAVGLTVGLKVGVPVSATTGTAMGGRVTPGMGIGGRVARGGRVAVWRVR